MTNYTLHTLDFPTLHRSAIGFDRLFDELNRTFANSRSDNYPPHNIAQLDDNHFVVEVAVAGFKEDELSVELDNNTLYVTGSTKSDETALMHYQGLSRRDFQHKYFLNENAVVGDVTLEYGILKIKLIHVPPKGKEPKKFEINSK